MLQKGWIWGEPHYLEGYVSHPDYKEKIVKFQGRWIEQVKVKYTHPDFQDVMRLHFPVTFLLCFGKL